MGLFQAASHVDGGAAFDLDLGQVDEMIAAVPRLTVAQLQEELSKRGLDTKWTPLKGKKDLVKRLTVSYVVNLLLYTLPLQ